METLKDYEEYAYQETWKLEHLSSDYCSHCLRVVLESIRLMAHLGSPTWAEQAPCYWEKPSGREAVI